MHKFCCIGITILFLYALPAKAEQRLLEDVIEEVNSSVVSITVDVSENEQALGAGVIISSDGYAVTNAHVMENAKKITLQTPDGETFSADLVGIDEKTDIALLKIIKPINLEAGHFGDSDTIRVGNRVFAIGNPFGLGNSVSLGIISAKERDIDKGPYDNFLQTDAAINQGNSGGPLFNTEGKIVGISTAIFSEDGKNAGVGFATPSNIVKWVVSQLKQHGKVIRGWLGVSVQNVRSLENEEEAALAISSMSENSPAAAAGLRVGDKILALGSISLKNPRLFSLEIAKLLPKTKVPVTFSRDGKIFNTEIIIKAAPEDAKKTESAANLHSFEELGLDKYKIGKALDFKELNLAAYYDEKAKELVVTMVSPGSEAEEKGIKVGDRIVLAGGKQIFGAEDMRIKLKQSAGSVILLQLRDNEGTYGVSLSVRK